MCTRVLYDVFDNGFKNDKLNLLYEENVNAQVDKLGKHAYEHPELLYKYKGVPIPPLGMVDDILSVTDEENTGI